MTLTGRTWLLFLSAAVGIGIYGVTFALLGTILALPEMHSRLHINAVQQGDLFLMVYAGVFLSNALVGPFIEAVGNKPVLISSALTVATALMWFASLGSISTAVCAAIILGFGGGSLNVSVNALVSEIYPTKRGSMLNLLGVFFGVGALCVPLGAATVLSRVGISDFLILGAVLPIVAAILYGILQFPSPKLKRGLVLLDSVRVLRYPGVLKVGLLLFFENADEAVVAAWTAIYVGALGFRPHTATLILGCYWASMMVGRVVASQLIKVVNKVTIILFAAGGAIAGCTLMFISTTPWALALAAMITGLSLAPIFKTALSIAGDRHPLFTGPIFGVLFAMSLLGAMGAPWLVGQISHHYSIHYGPLVPIFGSMCVMVLAFSIEQPRIHHSRRNQSIVLSAMRD